MTEAAFKKELSKKISKDGVAVVIHKVQFEPDDEDVLIAYIPGEPSYIVFGNYIGKKCRLSSDRKDWRTVMNDDRIVDEFTNYVKDTLKKEGLISGGTPSRQFLFFDNVEIVPII